MHQSNQTPQPTPNLPTRTLPAPTRVCNREHCCLLSSRAFSLRLSPVRIRCPVRHPDGFWFVNNEVRAKVWVVIGLEPFSRWPPNRCQFAPFLKKWCESNSIRFKSHRDSSCWVVSKLKLHFHFRTICTSMVYRFWNETFLSTTGCPQDQHNGDRSEPIATCPTSAGTSSETLSRSSYEGKGRATKKVANNYAWACFRWPNRNTTIRVTTILLMWPPWPTSILPPRPNTSPPLPRLAPKSGAHLVETKPLLLTKMVRKQTCSANAGVYLLVQEDAPPVQSIAGAHTCWQIFLTSIRECRLNAARLWMHEKLCTRNYQLCLVQFLRIFSVHTARQF